jgi:ATP-binding cassette subfamily B multidrug efflux pump
LVIFVLSLDHKINTFLPFMKELGYLNQYILKYKWMMLLGVVFIIISNLFAVWSPKVIQQAFDIINNALNARETIESGKEVVLQSPGIISYIFEIFGAINPFDDAIKSDESLVIIISKVTLLLALTYIVISLFKGVFTFFTRQTIIIISRRIEFDLKNKIYAHYQKLDQNFYKNNSTGDLMNRISEDVSRVRMYLGPAIMYSVNLITLFILAIGFMLKVNVTLTLYSLLPLPILSVTIYFVSSYINKRSERVQAKLSDLSSYTQEAFSGIRVLKSFSKERSSEELFELECQEYKVRSMHLVKVNAFFFPVMVLLIGLSTIFTIYIGGLQEIKGEISVGNIPEFVIYINMLTWPFAATGWVTSLIQRAAASQKRINEFLKTEPQIKNPITEEIEIKGNIEFDNISFTYENSGIQALKNVNLSIKAGETIGIIGRTGSGKSTLAAMIARFFDPDEGEIKIDGRDLRTLDLNNYRKNLGYVSQEDFLFSDTIENNIAFSKDEFDKETVIGAAKIAAIDSSLNELSKGYKTILGEKGINLSGGQKQRISIARAIISEPTILIFDDCLSALDTETEDHVLRNLNKLDKVQTKIFISHRVSTIRNANKIFVIDHGEIIEQGSHNELLKKGDLYSELFEQQLIEEGQVK